MSTPVSRTHAEEYHARRVPDPFEVTDGIWAVPVPLHGSPLRSITIFAIAGSAGTVLIDAGYRHPTCWESAREALARIGQPVERTAAVLITHNHPDHVGFASRIRDCSGARIVMHREDDFAHQDRERGGFLRQLREGLRLSGAPDDVVQEMYDAAVTVAVHDESLELDEQVTGHGRELAFGDVTITAVHAPGHTYGHTVYLDSRGVLFTGDTLMPEGPTQLAIVSRPDDDPLGDLLASLERIAALDAAIACPAHQYPYTDVATRALRLRDFHRAEADRVRELLDRYETAWEIAPHLSWPKPWERMGLGTRRFSLMHTLALLRSQAS